MTDSEAFNAIREQSEENSYLPASAYKLFFKDYTVYIFSRKDELPDNYSIGEMADDQAKAMKTPGYEDFGHAAYEEAPDFNKRILDF